MSTGLLLFIAFFLPALIALRRRYHNASAIFALNLLAGWTLIGWVVAFVSAHPAAQCLAPHEPTAPQTRSTFRDWSLRRECVSPVCGSFRAWVRSWAKRWPLAGWHANAVTERARHDRQYGLHILRQACASLLIEQGMSVKRAQTIPGHSTTAMTLDVYGHWYPAPEDDQAAMRELQSRLLG
jgi:hypothetical protein